MDNRPLMVVTGATNGLGRLAAINLAIGGADLAVIARSTDRPVGCVGRSKPQHPKPRSTSSSPICRV